MDNYIIDKLIEIDNPCIDCRDRFHCVVDMWSRRSCMRNKEYIRELIEVVERCKKLATGYYTTTEKIVEEARALCEKFKVETGGDVSDYKAFLEILKVMIERGDKK